MLNYFDINQIELEYLSDDNKIKLEHNNATNVSNMQEKTIPSHGMEGKTVMK